MYQLSISAYFIKLVTTTCLLSRIVYKRKYLVNIVLYVSMFNTVETAFRLCHQSRNMNVLTSEFESTLGQFFLFFIFISYWLF